MKVYCNFNSVEGTIVPRKLPRTISGAVELALQSQLQLHEEPFLDVHKQGWEVQQHIELNCSYEILCMNSGGLELFDLFVFQKTSMETTKANPTLTRKLHKILETRVDGQELVTALETLSQFYGKNTLQARRNLRGIVEKRGLEINRNFLQVFLQVQQVI
jgi:hypothetical protein